MKHQHQKQWIFLKTAIDSNQLAHAYLFSGSREADLEGFSKELIEYLLCSSKQKPCKTCHSCALVEKNQYPDVFVVKSQNSKSSVKDGEDKQEIDVGLIREAQNFLAYKSYYDSYKVVIIENADRMNGEAQNCFLKNLEEPKGRTLILMLTSKPETLLPTIFSRCQHIVFSAPNKVALSPEENALLQGFLKIAPLDLAEKFLYAKNADLGHGNFGKMLEVLQKYFRQELLVKIGVLPQKDASPLLQNYSLEKLKKILNLLEETSYTSMVYNASPKLALEILLMEI